MLYRTSGACPAHPPPKSRTTLPGNKSPPPTAGTPAAATPTAAAGAWSAMFGAGTPSACTFAPAPGSMCAYSLPQPQLRLRQPQAAQAYHFQRGDRRGGQGSQGPRLQLQCPRLDRGLDRMHADARHNSHLCSYMHPRCRWRAEYRRGALGSWVVPASSRGLRSPHHVCRQAVVRERPPQRGEARLSARPGRWPAWPLSCVCHCIAVVV